MPACDIREFPALSCFPDLSHEKRSAISVAGEPRSDVVTMNERFAGDLAFFDGSVHTGGRLQETRRPGHRREERRSGPLPEGQGRMGIGD